MTGSNSSSRAQTKFIDDAAIVVRVASASDAATWDGFVADQAAGSFYHLFGWREITKSSFAHTPVYLMAWQSGRAVGVLPLVLVSSRIFGRILCSVPFVNYGGPCAESDDIAKRLVEHAVSTSEALEADYLELRCAAPLATALPVSLRKISMNLALHSDPEVLWNAFTTKHRNNIRRAYKNRLELRSGGIELLPDFIGVLEQAWRDLGTPLYKPAFFRAILKEFPDNTRIFVCYKDARPLCAAFNGSLQRTLEGMWAGALPAARELQANYVLYWEMIQYACRAGFTKFHLGRSTVDSGSERFKGRWNADTGQLYWYHHRPGGGPMPSLNVDNPRYRLAIAAWRRLPLWAVRRLGPPLARCIP